MKILITGAKGFIGRNLIAELKSQGFRDIIEIDQDSSAAHLQAACAACHFVFHLAGINRPTDPQQFVDGNQNYTAQLIAALQQAGNRSPVVFSSSIQAWLENPYGVSKKSAELLLRDHALKQQSVVHIFRLNNVFGKWCRPNYNSVVATFCYNIANQLDIQVNEGDRILQFVYIDDVVKAFIEKLKNSEQSEHEFVEVKPVYPVRISDLALQLRSFSDGRDQHYLPYFQDDFVRKLYATYISYLPVDSLGVIPRVNSDERGSFTEIMRTHGCGQISINVAHPGIVKGNHWHHSKTEKFLVIKGEGIIRFRSIWDDRVIEYRVSDQIPCLVDIPPGYTHHIENTGDEDMITVMWASEIFDKTNPDTIPEDVYPNNR